MKLLNEKFKLPDFKDPNKSKDAFLKERLNDIQRHLSKSTPKRKSYVPMRKDKQEREKEREKELEGLRQREREKKRDEVREKELEIEREKGREEKGK